MTKYELSISADYVPRWGIIEAVRELFQNALDEQVKDPENKLFFDYDGYTVRIGNKNSTLDIKSLLIGSTTKKDDDRFIGQHGEGYKLAAIVSMRTGHPITFYNYNVREVWTTRLVKSRKYNGALVPTFFVDKLHVWNSVPTNALIIEIENVNPDEYEEIKATNLHLQDTPPTRRDTKYGSVLTDTEHAHMLFVSGLYVCMHKDMEYGYDLAPGMIKLDRDRGLVDDFNLFWTTSQILGATDDPVFISSALPLPDAKYLTNASYVPTKVRQLAYGAFKEKHGDSAIPVSTNSQLEEAQQLGLKAVMVTETEQISITSAPSYIAPPKKLDLSDRFEEWFDQYGDEGADEFKALLKELRENE